jgi:hypothetical protein
MLNRILISITKVHNLNKGKIQNCTDQSRRIAGQDIFTVPQIFPYKFHTLALLIAGTLNADPQNDRVQFVGPFGQNQTCCHY